MQLGSPERLVDVDVPEPGQDALIEQGRLERSSTPGQALAQQLRGELRCQRFRADASGQVALQLACFEQVPGSEATHVAVDELGTVVQLEPGPLVRERTGARTPVPERSRHTEMDSERFPALQNEKQVLAAAIERRDLLAGERGRDLSGSDRPRQPRIADLGVDALPAREQRPEPAARRLTL